MNTVVDAETSVKAYLSELTGVPVQELKDEMKLGLFGADAGTLFCAKFAVVVIDYMTVAELVSSVKAK